MGLDIGTLTGHVDIEDNLSSTFDRMALKVEHFAQNFEGLLGGLVIGSAAVIGAIGGVSAAIIALGEHGSEINDVSQNLDRLAGSAENATKVLGAMRTGTAGTVSDFKLMSEANKLLQSGVAADATTFGTLTAAARVLSREGFGSLPDVLAQVDRGMQTGLLRGQLMRSLHVDLRAGEKAYAESMGITAGELNKSQKLLADRQTIMTGLTNVVKKAGEQELNFKEMIEKGEIAIENWGNKLAASVAASPHVLAAVNAIGKALTDNFSGSGETAIELITGWVNKFADAVSYYGPKVIEWIKSVITYIEGIYQKVTAYWDTVPEWFKRIMLQATLAGGAIILTDEALSHIGGGDTVSRMANIAQIVGTLTNELRALKVAMEGLTFAGAASAVSGMLTGATVWVTTWISAFSEFGVAALGLATGPIGTVLAALAEFGGAVAALATGPVGLLVGAVAGLGIGLRTLLGSWDFITTPVSDAGRVIKDLTVILVGLVKTLGTDLVHAAKDAADAIGEKFKPAVAIAEIGWDLIKSKIQAAYEAYKIWAKLPGNPGWSAAKLDAAAEIAAGFPSMAPPAGPGGILPGGLQIPTAASTGLMGKPGGSTPEIAEPIALSPGAQSIYNQLVGIDADKKLREFRQALGALGQTPLTLPGLQEAGKLLDELVAKGEALDPAMKKLYADWVDIKDIVAESTAGLKADADARAQIDAQLERNNQISLSSATQRREAIHNLAATGLNEALAYAQAESDAVGASMSQQWAARAEYYRLVKEKEEEDYRFTVEKINAAAEEQKRDNEDMAGIIDETTKKLIAAATAMHNFTQSKNDIDQVDDSMKRVHQTFGDTVIDLEHLRDKSVQTYRDMIAVDRIWFQITGQHLYTVDQLRTKYQAALADATKFFLADHQGWSKSLEILGTVSDRLQALGSSFGGVVGAWVGGIGQIVGGIQSWVHHLAEVRAAQANGLAAPTMTGAEKVAGLMNAAGSIFAATGGPSKTANIVGGALSGAAAGAAMYAWTGPYGIAIGAIAGAVTGWVRSMHQAEEAQRGLDQQLEKMHDTINTTYGSWNEAMKRAAQLGVNVADATGSSMHHSTEDINRVKDQLNELAATEQHLIDLTEKYGLTWKDLDAADAMKAATKAADQLLKDMQLLKNAGYNTDAILKGMSGDINDWLNSALKAGVKIPPALGPIIEQLIRSKQLTEENAALLLGLGDQAKPSFQQIVDAADRYGLKLADLGKGVQGIRLGEVADQIAADFKLLSEAGAPFNAIMKDTEKQITDTGIDFSTMSSDAQKAYTDAGGKLTPVMVGMHKQIQDVITDSQKMGIDIPANLQPIIQKLIDAGGDNGLVDQFGNKLTSTSQLNFQKPLADKIDELITKLGLLIDKISNGPNSLAGALDGLPTEKKIRIHIEMPPASDFPLPPGLVYTPTYGGGAETPPEMDQPLQYVRSSGLVKVNPGDVVGMPSLTPADTLAGLSRSEERVTVPITLQVGSEKILKQTVRTIIATGGITGRT